MTPLAVLVHNRGQAALCVRTARHLARTEVTLPTGEKTRLRITVYDDGSPPGERKALERLPGAVERLFSPSPRGLGWIIDHLMRVSPCDRLLVVQPGVEIDAAAIASLVKALDRDTAAVVPHVTGQDSDPSPICCLLARSALERVGPLSEGPSPQTALSSWIDRARHMGLACVKVDSVTVTAPGTASLNTEASTSSGAGEPNAIRGKKDGGGREPYEIDLYRPGDETEICACFRRVFDKDKPLHVWRWQFADNPAGTRIFVARTSSGRIVAQFAGIPVRMSLEGKPHTFTQMVDNMVDPAHRQGLRRSGVFSEVVYRYVDHFGNPAGETIGFGLPNPQAFRIGRRLLGYSHIQDVYETSRILTAEDAARQDPEVEGHRIEVTSTPPSGVDTLFSRVIQRHRLMAVRDRTYLSWRYEQSPLATFHFVSAVRENGPGPAGSGTLLAYAVLRTSYLEDKGTAAIVDLLSLPGEDQAVQSIVRRCERMAIDDRCGRMVAFFRNGAQEAAHLESLGYATVKSDWLLVGRTYHPEVTLEWAGEHWYYTLGDFDLV